MPGYGYGYGASRDETSDSESSRESESSESEASEVEVDQGARNPPAQPGRTPEALPRRRSVTFKEEVLILTDSAREFTKLSFRQGAPRKRFKEPPPTGKRIRTGAAGRVLRSPPPERPLLGQPEVPSVVSKRKPEDSHEVTEAECRNKRNRKDKSRSPDGLTTAGVQTGEAVDTLVKDTKSDPDALQAHVRVEKQVHEKAQQKRTARRTRSVRCCMLLGNCGFDFRFRLVRAGFRRKAARSRLLRKTQRR
ncbi:unnamed protein product [Symbiodinium pilosum]|uniref:Uncharacterized protein n=1 Tax=Symbiodinium pilosum TaxID=2952 RepID=A0A812MPU2_SYMPI|nr:unnamed protein product [Symbiodinium pilosum]